MQEIYQDLQHLLEARAEALARCIQNSVSGPETRLLLLQRMDAVQVNRRNLISACEQGL
jgi:hypothetical protein